MLYFVYIIYNALKTLLKTLIFNALSKVLLNL
jgi:hypothetical protein